MFMHFPSSLSANHFGFYAFFECMSPSPPVISAISPSQFAIVEPGASHIQNVVGFSYRDFVLLRISYVQWIRVLRELECSWTWSWLMIILIIVLTCWWDQGCRRWATEPPNHYRSS